MKPEEIDALARKRELLPENATLSERSLYHSLVMLYTEYRQGVIDKDSAKKEKTALFASYGAESLQERIWTEHARRMKEIEILLTRANKGDCPLCKEIAEIFDGRRRFASDEQETETG